MTMTVEGLAIMEHPEQITFIAAAVITMEVYMHLLPKSDS